MRNLKRITLYIMSIVDIFSLIAAFIVSYIIKFRLVEKIVRDWFHLHLI